MSKRISVIIPTYKRYEDILPTLDSLNQQTLLPDDVIIFDESPDDVLRTTLRNFKAKYPIKYIWSPSEFRLLARARNKAGRLSKGDVILFLDDDVLLDPCYLENLVSFLKNYPNVMGLMGFIMNQTRFSFLYELMNRLFLRPYHSQSLKVLRSFVPTYTESPVTSSTEWLSGCNMAYKREVFEHLEFDWKLLKYSYSEDVDFSFRVFKKIRER